MTQLQSETLYEMTQDHPVFDWVRGVLYDQRTTATRYIERIVTLFSFATAIVGLGLPLLSSQGEIPQSLLIAAIVAYACTAVAVLYGLFPRGFNTADTPSETESLFKKYGPQKFGRELLEEIKTAYECNEPKLKQLAWTMTAIAALVTLDTVLITVIVFKTVIS